MPCSFFQYEMMPTTWFYLSSLIILAAFFQFNRFWSIRNFDLLGLIFFTPGLLLLAMHKEHTGYVWLFGIGALFCVRLICDNLMLRRPLAGTNLTVGGQLLTCGSILLFVFIALLVNRGSSINTVRTLRLEQILVAPADSHWDNRPPGFRPFLSLTVKTNLLLAPAPSLFSEYKTAAPQDSDTPNDPKVTISIPPNIPAPNPPFPLLSFLFIAAGHIAITAALIYIGSVHFGSFSTGVTCATLYLLHPYANQMIGRLDHLLPAALILWAVALYRRPLLSGLAIGSAAALVWYPLVLVPLWCSYYWRRGLVRFIIGTAAAAGTFAGLLVLSPAALGTYGEQLMHLSGRTALMVVSEPDGFWDQDDIYYRMPVLALYCTVCCGLFFYPIRKHLGTLLSCSALLMLGVQFVQLYQGGLYMAWYLPLLILTIFRPNLDDKTAVH